MADWRTNFDRIAGELAVSDLYDTVSKRVDRITEAASGLADKFYKEIVEATSEILLLVAANEKKGES